MTPDIAPLEQDELALLELDTFVKAAILDEDPEGDPADDLEDQGYESPFQTRASLGI